MSQLVEVCVDLRKELGTVLSEGGGRLGGDRAVVLLAVDADLVLERGVLDGLLAYGVADSG